MKLCYRFAGVILLAAILLPLLSGCVEQPIYRDAQTQEFYSSYTEIPGVTQDEIDAIEALKASRGSFSYYMNLSTECFYRDGGTIGGFTPLFANWLSELFGISFTPTVHKWNELIYYVDKGSADFTSAISTSRSSHYIMTEAISERVIKHISTEGAEKLAIQSTKRLLRYGFLKGSGIHELVHPYIHYKYEIVEIENLDHAYQMLLQGNIDAIFEDGTVAASFGVNNSLIISNFSPVTYNPVSLATKNPELEPIISVVQKYIENGGAPYIMSLKEQGRIEYLNYIFMDSLDDEEKNYLKIHQNPAAIIPVAATYDNYPISFYNEQEDEWQGISIDLLKEIEKLTGMSFGVINTRTDNWIDVFVMLEDGVAAMNSELIRTDAREGEFLWTDKPYTTDSFALLSSIDYADMSFNQVANARVGIITGTAYADVFNEMYPNHQWVTEYANRNDAYDALERGEIDLLMMTRNLLLSVTNYMERAGYKVNLIFDRPYESAFGFNKEEVILRSLISKAQSIIDTDAITDNWIRKVFDYRGKLARAQVPYLAAILAMFGVVLIMLMFLLVRRRQTGKRLEETVRSRTQELEVQTKMAQVASSAKSDFLARMSHEIRTPLNAIMGMTEIAKRSESADKKAESLDKITTASTHLLGILNDVLDMSKIESGKFVLSYEPFALLPAMDEVSNIITQRCEDGGIDFDVDFDIKPEHAVIGDKLRLKQVLINLLGNAVKFTLRDGHIKFSVHSEDAEDGKIKVAFSVADTGIGMTEVQMSKLFVAFEQADRTISTRFGGTGLGLAISQNLVMQMSGEIIVESELGKGSTFAFTLLLDKTVIEGEKPQQADEETYFFPGKRILLAEDVDINRMILMELLGETQLTIDEAVDGQAAVDRFDGLEEGYYDLVFMDIQMPNLNGYEAAERIRSLEREDVKTLPIIAMTANAYKEDIERAMQAGMNGHLSKPINIDDVLVTLEKYLGKGAE